MRKCDLHVTLKSLPCTCAHRWQPIFQLRVRERLTQGRKRPTRVARLRICSHRIYEQQFGQSTSTRCMHDRVTAIAAPRRPADEMSATFSAHVGYVKSVDLEPQCTTRIGPIKRGRAACSGRALCVPGVARSQ